MIEGNLTDFSLNDVLDMISSGEKTGVLSITGDTPFGRRSGKIYFEKGKIKDAETEESKGESAVINLLSVKEGTFKFTAFDTATIKKSVKKSIQDLMLLTASKLDEWNKIKEKISSADAVFTLSDEDIPEALHFSPLEWKVINLLGKGYSIKEIAAKLNTTVMDVSKLIYKFISLKIVKEVDQKKIEQKNITEKKTTQIGSIFRRHRNSEKS